MRRITALMTLTLATVVLSAGAAFADSTYPPTVVKGANGSRGGAGGGTAFTGSAQLPFAMLMVAILVLVGVAALSAVFVARRRAARFAV